MASASFLLTHVVELLHVLATKQKEKGQSPTTIQRPPGVDCIHCCQGSQDMLMAATVSTPLPSFTSPCFMGPLFVTYCLEFRQALTFTRNSNSGSTSRNNSTGSHITTAAMAKLATSAAALICNRSQYPLNFPLSSA